MNVGALLYDHSFGTLLLEAIGQRTIRSDLLIVDYKPMRKFLNEAGVYLPETMY